MLAAQTMADAHAASSTSASQSLAMPPELEQTLTILTSHRSVLGYMLLSRSQPVTIIRNSGVVFEGEQGKKYASAIARIVHSVQTGLEDVSSGQSDTVSPCSQVHSYDPAALLVSHRPPRFGVFSDHSRSLNWRAQPRTDPGFPTVQDEIRFMRIRTKRHEIMISPGAYHVCARRRDCPAYERAPCCPLFGVHTLKRLRRRALSARSPPRSCDMRSSPLSV